MAWLARSIGPLAHLVLQASHLPGLPATCIIRLHAPGSSILQPRVRGLRAARVTGGRAPQPSELVLQHGQLVLELPIVRPQRARLRLRRRQPPAQCLSLRNGSPRVQFVSRWGSQLAASFQPFPC